MTKIYFDNAATTPILLEVAAKMYDSLLIDFGNPSSTHSFGRSSKVLIETARKNIASHFNISASEIVFTSGGSEADTMILRNAVTNLNVKTIITSKIEHHAVLHSIEQLLQKHKIEVLYVRIDKEGKIDYKDLEKLLKKTSHKTLVSLMYINNEIGTILDLEKVSGLCRTYKAYFHSDTVQGIGKYVIDLQKTPIDFITASAHKFHGPKGVGFAYFKKGIGIAPLIHGGEQERGARAGTENTAGIIGMELALTSSLKTLVSDRKYISDLKALLINKLIENLPKIRFNTDLRTSAYNIISLRFEKEIPMLLFKLDMKGIAVSGGSACQSGSNKGSHVLSNILTDIENTKTSVRISFSKFNTKKEILTFIKALSEIIQS